MNTATKIKTYPIVETFHSVQGEGYWTGVNAFFIRLAGCDVHCPWCDTKHSWNPQRHPQKSTQELATEAKKAEPAIVIVTGGEPLMHNLFPLTTALRSAGMRVHLETSGAHPFSGDFDWVTFSPKQFKAPHQSVYDRTNELKVVVTNKYDLKWAEQQSALVSKTALYYLQPEWNSPKSKQLIFDYILQHPEWCISLQTHKLLEIQ
ncbi:7-carboxy-7-deazaguanine synthase QueE [Waterburya agarophytonicola K14]|uniref:7-carboxy-7-deazaguanine synthase n=1 Tax=Waterburya agarophytonicola KI4 TaxID=2874699 RepID=A0A964FI72_9CYAN|nr:7-carboxy-7-deazaguanine synthase QueE [Waterburya agarophytonicola]MCC0179696.1 7-carboxy-7-deazaguanine synthase QueE [Waterburya agarophytonicola KI4]